MELGEREWPVYLEKKEFQIRPPISVGVRSLGNASYTWVSLLSKCVWMGLGQEWEDVTVLDDDREATLNH